MQSHDRATFGFVLPEVRGHGRQVRSTRHVWNPLASTGGLAAFDVFVVFVDAGQCGHMENVSDAVFWLLGWALDVGCRDLLGHAGTLRRKTFRLTEVLFFCKELASITKGFAHFYRGQLNTAMTWLESGNWNHLTFQNVLLIYKPGHKKLALVDGWKAPQVCSDRCAGPTCSRLTASWCWDKTPGSHLSTEKKDKIASIIQEFWHKNKVNFVF